MSLAKAVLSGIVYRNPEKRFTTNNIPVTSFAINIDEKEQTLIRVVARGNIAESAEQSIKKGDKIVVEGRLQITAAQLDDGTEKKITEIDLSSFEVINSNKSESDSTNKDEVVKFSEVEMDDVLVGEEEIPF